MRGDRPPSPAGTPASERLGGRQPEAQENGLPDSAPALAGDGGSALQRTKPVTLQSQECPHREGQGGPAVGTGLALPQHRDGPQVPTRTPTLGRKPQNAEGTKTMQRAETHWRRTPHACAHACAHTNTHKHTYTQMH